MIKTTNMQEILTEVSEYYSNKISTHGATPQGVDWNSHMTQDIRFEQLTKIIETNDFFSINDLGCGYGALFDYLQTQYRDTAFHYNGIDISQEMIAAAQNKNVLSQKAEYFVGSEPPQICDFGIASGIFNVRLGRSDTEWVDYFQATLDVLDRTSQHGFSFNCLTSYSDQDKMQDYLYYADPCKIFDYCKKRYSRQVALLHDYGLYEFTILVRKNK